MIPTTTGAARATSLVLPEVKGRIDGMAIRVPTPNVSLVDLTAEVRRDTNVDEVNRIFSEMALGPLKGILDVSDEPLVSVDYIGNSHSAVVDLASTAVIGNRLVKVLAWYDNEWGYSNRIVDMVRFIGERLPPRNGAGPG
jgi:glyceraldehyde 3-phosphate dehydrogenase